MFLEEEEEKEEEEKEQKDGGTQLRRSRDRHKMLRDCSEIINRSKFKLPTC